MYIKHINVPHFEYLKYISEVFESIHPEKAREVKYCFAESRNMH